MYGLKHQKEKRSMDHFAGLDVSVKATSVCIVDDTGKVVREVKVTCPSRKSYPRIPMMQSRQDRCGDNGSGSLDSSW